MAGRNVNFYFAYEVMSQLAALYGVACRENDNDRAPAILASVMADLGTAFKLSQSFETGAEGESLLPKSRGLELDERLRRLQPRITPWTDRRRWLHIMRASESCWRATLEDWARCEQRMAAELSSLVSSSRARTELLIKRSAHVRETARRRNESYAVPVPL